MLKSQGFRYNDVVDIFDAGPTVEAFIDHLDTVREARLMKGSEFAANLRPNVGLIANPSIAQFSVTQFAREDDPREILRRIGAGDSDDVLVYRLKGSRA
jgi:arginine N-succinyltransferase